MQKPGSRVRLIGQSLVFAAVAAVAFLNLWDFVEQASSQQPRKEDQVGVAEWRLRWIRDALYKAHYLRGDIAYIPGRVLDGGAQTPDETSDWMITHYVMIPWNVVENTLNAPYLILDYSRWDKPVVLPAGFTTVYDSGDGLMLLRKLESQ
jgi:hypothetical protein